MGKPEAVIVGVADAPLKDGKVLTPMSVLQLQALAARDALGVGLGRGHGSIVPGAPRGGPTGVVEWPTWL